MSSSKFETDRQKKIDELLSDLVLATLPGVEFGSENFDLAYQYVKSNADFHSFLSWCCGAPSTALVYRCGRHEYLLRYLRLLLTFL